MSISIVRRAVTLAGAVLTLMVGLVVGPLPAAQADPAADRAEQTRFARESVDMSIEDFMRREDDFWANGCQNGPDGCRKPSPYNAFDWTTDYCSGPERVGPIATVLYADLFHRACRQHDFGYRNFGRRGGPMFERTEAMRAHIDARFHDEMLRTCARKYKGLMKSANRTACQIEANAVYAFVRNASHW